MSDSGVDGGGVEGTGEGGIDDGVSGVGGARIDVSDGDGRAGVVGVSISTSKSVREYSTFLCMSSFSSSLAMFKIWVRFDRLGS